MESEHGQDLVLGPGTHGLCGDLAVLHHHQGGDAHDLEGLGQLGLFIHIARQISWVMVPMGQ